MVDDRMQDKAVIEAALFLSPDALSFRALAKLIDASQQYVRALLEEMRNDLLTDDRGLEIQVDQTRASFQVKRAYVDQVAHLAPQQDIHRSVLRTLAVVAYNQPVTQADIVKVRGNKAYSHIQELLERGLIRGEQHGRTQLLEVTDEFLRYFGLSSREEFRFHFAGADPSDLEEGNNASGERSEPCEGPEREASDPSDRAGLEQELRSFDLETAAQQEEPDLLQAGESPFLAVADDDEAGG